MDRKNNDKSSKGEAFAKYFKIGIISLVVLAVVAVGFMVIPPFIKINVASVGQEKVRNYEFKYYLVQLKSNMYDAAKQNNPNLTEEQFWSTPIKGEKAIDVAKKDVLEAIKSLKIQVNKAKAAGIKLEKNDLDYIDSVFNSMVSSYGSKEALEAQLQTYGINSNQLKDMYKEQRLVSKFRDSQITGMKLTEADIKTFYDKNPDIYKTLSYSSSSGQVNTYRPDAGEAVWVRRILVNVASDAAAADKETARTKAQGILDKAKAGSDFAALIKQNTADTASNISGGTFVIELGKDLMGAEFEKAVSALTPGQVSDLVQSSSGYEIIKLEEKYGKDQPVSLKCAQEYLGLDYVKDQKYQMQLNDWKKDTAYDVKITNKGVYDSIEK